MAYEATRDRKNDAEARASILYGVGAAVTLGGVTWVLLSYTLSPSDKAPVVGVIPTRTGAALSVGWRF